MVFPLANLPNSRDTFKAFCLRRLGAPVININIDEAQVEDCVNSALSYWFDFHIDGTEKTYYKYQLLDVDFTNKYITLPANIIGAVNIFDITSSMRQDNIFNIRYQIVLNDLYTLTSLDMVPFYQTFQHLQFLEEILIGKQPIRYNRYNNLLYLDMDWNRFITGDFIIAECYGVIDPDTYTQAWSDRMLIQLACAYLKRQWGQNLIKFNGLQMPGGTTFNGQFIYTEGVREVQETENEILRSYSPMAAPMIG